LQIKRFTVVIRWWWAAVSRRFGVNVTCFVVIVRIIIVIVRSYGLSIMLIEPVYRGDWLGWMGMGYVSTV